MSRLRLGLNPDGTRHTLDEGPNEAHRKGGNTRATTAGAFPIAYITPGVERPASHHPVKARVGRRYRAGRAR